MKDLDITVADKCKFPLEQVTLSITYEDDEGEDRDEEMKGDFRALLTEIAKEHSVIFNDEDWEKMSAEEMVEEIQKHNGDAGRYIELWIETKEGKYKSLIE